MIISTISCKQNFKLIAVPMLVALITSAAIAQGKVETEQMISASRGAAAPLLFKATSADITTINPGKFYNENETVVRNGLGNFFQKLNTQKHVTVGYIGGSITQGGYGYRMQSARYLQQMYPGIELDFLNAGVSGTGTELGACRIKEQILSHQPDLIFIEFAVNGAYQDGMEGMIRQIIKNNPKTDICLLYTLLGPQTTVYANNGIPENIKGLENIASHYNLPSIHLGMEVAALEKEHKLVWKSDANSSDGLIVFSNDGVHPTVQGGNLYAAAIARGINKLRDANKQATDHQLKEALFADDWENAQMLDPLEVGRFSKGWDKITTKGNTNLGQFNSWFPYVMFTQTPGSSFSFDFTGTTFGFYDLGGPDVGEVSIEVDNSSLMLRVVASKGYQSYYKAIAGSPAGDPLINRFNIFCNNRYRGQYEFINVEPGTHHVTVKLSGVKADKSKILGEKQQNDINAHPEKYDATTFYLGKILIKGQIVKP